MNRYTEHRPTRQDRVDAEAETKHRWALRLEEQRARQEVAAHIKRVGHTIAELRYKPQLCRGCHWCRPRR